MSISPAQLVPWAFSPLGLDETRAEVHYQEKQVESFIGIDLGGFNRVERRQILASKVEMRMILFPPLLIFLVQTGIANFDAPFCSSINGRNWHEGLVEALEAPRSLNIYATFVLNNIVHRHHRLIIDSTTGPAIAGALRSCPTSLALDNYNQAVDAYQQVLSPNKLLALSRSLDFLNKS